MASVFTYDPDPPRVSSPWTPLSESGKDEGALGTQLRRPAQEPQPGLLSEYGVIKLQAEPQEGPTEYKLHLLLRPRRVFKNMSTAGTSRHARLNMPSTASLTPSSQAREQTRQQRLQHLTTQLLWRLQQSSPYHASSSKELAIPRLPDDSVDLSAPVKLSELVPGLEESRGALYEIGVADDGTLVGLTKDEMEESLTTLRVMAASLGCSVDVHRRVIVGDCEWVESTELVDSFVTSPHQIIRNGKLWVAEALVKPNFGFLDEENGTDSSHKNEQAIAESAAVPSRGSSTTPQLRVTFTGPTTSGKSSLLGTLSTGTLDNGRGNSRLSLLKHRHEVATGVTSSIAQELIGYKDQSILNYSHGNIESWVDIHDCSEGGRLVFVSDSAGHPRYRRTVLRGLMNWAPHWIILCLAVDDGDTATKGHGVTSSTQDVLGVTSVGVDLVKAHLTLSLKLDIPLAVVITKMDLASKTSAHRTTNKILSAVKEAGRIPKILRPDQKVWRDLDRVPDDDSAKVKDLLKGISESGNLTEIVPIAFTSAVRGSGIGLLHALLENLPLPPIPAARDYVGMALNPEQPKCLFHIDDTFSLPTSYSNMTGVLGKQADPGIVVSGYLRFGRLSVGDKIVIGPFPPNDDEARDLTPEDRQSPGSYGLSISHPSSAELARIAMKNAVSASATPGEWHDAQIVSIRNLRLPVLTLESGQAGSIGLVIQSLSHRSQNGNPDSNIPIEPPRIRRGMILAIPSKHMADTGLKLQAASGFTAVFDDADTQALAIGSFVNIYIASIRTVARIRQISRQDPGWEAGAREADEIEEIFDLNDDLETNNEKEEPDATRGGVEMGLELIHHREWIEMGSRVILLEGGSQDKSGLEGFVGKVVEIVD
ncbi:GTP-binding protein 2 [Fusarium oxysporum f. sp. cubense race 1]|uniref:GTP-binding protein 2 n=1 Tax=Fusarium oxysporum f. sp. cubense (strain race 1) TaxID=1229664 RepID=N4U9J2_FUSC1|nr:GTP-binding protein 2 [Fusarium oxysporum f. sp. cubense race 1]